MDSEAKIVACMRAAGAELGLPALSEAVMRNVIGLGLREAMDMLYPGYDMDTHRRYTERYRHQFMIANTLASTLFPGALARIAKLHSDGYLLAVATGKGRHGVNLALKEVECG